MYVAVDADVVYNTDALCISIHLIRIVYTNDVILFFSLLMCSSTRNYVMIGSTKQKFTSNSVSAQVNMCMS